MMALLSCPLCLNPHFTGVDALRTSLITIANSNILCPVCNQLFLGLDKLTIHLFSHINNKQTVEIINKIEITTNCETENASRIEPDAEVVKSKCLRCDICHYHFSDEVILDLHQKLLHQTVPDKSTGDYNYHCHLCSKQFKKRGSLMVHLRVVHYGFIQHNKQVCNCNETQKLHSNESNCDKQVVKGTEQLKPAKQKGNEWQENKQWECDICLKLFTTKYFLKKHKRLHTGEMPYYCSQCNKYFTFQQSYHKHMLYHSDDKPHICVECGRSFKELSTLHNHQRIHSGERPFSCETCGKCFRQRVSYLVHRRIHTGVMPYKCTACNKRFRYKVSQRSHKCPIDPPGNVVRTPDLVYKLIENRKIISNQGGSNMMKTNIFDQICKPNDSTIDNGVPSTSPTHKIYQLKNNSTVPNGSIHLEYLINNNNQLVLNTSDIPVLISSNLGEYMSIEDAPPKISPDINPRIITLPTINEDSLRELLYSNIKKDFDELT